MNERQQRFLTAYQADPRIAPAARAARVNRASVYRWQADPAFVAAMKVASDAFYAEWKATYARQEQQRAAEKAERAKGLLSLRRSFLAQARATLKKKREQGTVGRR